MTFKALTLKLTPLLMLIFVAPMGTGCGKYNKRLKRKLGLRSQSIKITDLGKSYKKYKGSEFDVFSFSSKVRKKTKRKDGRSNVPASGGTRWKPVRVREETGLRGGQMKDLGKSNAKRRESQ